MPESNQHSGPYLAAEGETWVLKADYDALELSHAAAIAQRDRYRTAHARLEEQLEALRIALTECLFLAENNNELSEIQRLRGIHRTAREALASNPAKERDPALCRHGYDLTQKDECPLCKAQEALSEWEPARWCRRCGVYGCEHVLSAQSPASEPESL